LLKYTDVSEERPASIIRAMSETFIVLMMEVVSTSETSVFSNKTTLHGATSQKALIFMLAAVRT
jgi:hypothetical protein